MDKGHGTRGCFHLLHEALSSHRTHNLIAPCYKRQPALTGRTSFLAPLALDERP